LAGAALVSSLSGAGERTGAEHIIAEHTIKEYDMGKTMMVLVSGMLAASARWLQRQLDPHRSE
jgi:hypothetical protein